jgi:uncharacterized protein
MSLEAIVKSNYAAFGRGDIATILQSMTPSVEWLARYPSSIPFAGLHDKHEGIIALFQAINAALEVLRFEIVAFHVTSNAVFVEGEEEARVRATGKSYVNAWIHIWEFDEAGLVKRVSNYNDSAAAANAFAA